MRSVIELIPIICDFMYQVWCVLTKPTATFDYMTPTIRFCECGHREADHYWEMDRRGCDPEPRTSVSQCQCTGFRFLHDQYEDDLDIIRRRLDEANTRVQSVNITSDEYHQILRPALKVNPAPWYVPPPVASHRRAVKLPKKD